MVERRIVCMHRSGKNRHFCSNEEEKRTKMEERENLCCGCNFDIRHVLGFFSGFGLVFFGFGPGCILLGFGFGPGCFLWAYIEIFLTKNEHLYKKKITFPIL